MYVSIQELVKGDVITDSKWEVKEDMNAVLSGECVRRGEKFETREGNLDHTRTGGNLSVLQKNLICRM